jgi:hypothetical protein
LPASHQRADQNIIQGNAVCSELLTLQNLFCIDCFIPRFDLGGVVQNHVQQGIMNFQFSIVFDKTQFAEFVHEKAHARSRRADHLRQRFLTELSHDRLGPAFLAEIREEKEKSGEALFARIEQLINQVLFNSTVPSQEIRHEKLGKFR